MSRPYHPKHPNAGYSIKYDCFYENGEWLEKACNDPDCEFCRDRPEKPPTEKPVFNSEGET